MKKSSASKLPSGRPKKRSPTFAMYRRRLDSRNGKIYEFVKTTVAADPIKYGSIERAINAAMTKFHVAARSTVQRQIAPYKSFEKGIKQSVKFLSSAVIPYIGLTERLAVFYSERELIELGNISINLALNLAEEREELERFRLLHKQQRRKPAAIK